MPFFQGILRSFKLVPECQTPPEDQIRMSVIGCTRGNMEASLFPLVLLTIMGRCGLREGVHSIDSVACGRRARVVHIQWELHRTVKVTDTPATYPFGHVVGLASLDKVQPWAELV